MSKDNLIDKALNVAADAGSLALEKISSPTSRSGIVIERVGKMAAAGVADNVIAVQLSSGSSTKHEYTVEQVVGMKALFADCHTKVPVSRPVTEALIEDAKSNPAPSGDGLIA
ncbi:hypothetical protein [Pantoea ananatis]|uniref:hypothetical protein n=1 Tax=Pantoea ananas TaxID=553 RepID=UPI0002E42699|nr:hypothetical protein [Pantoea ananatis]